MAFQGDFEKIDDEIQVQLRALLKNDFDTIDKLKRQEMSKDDIKYYLADNFQKRELDMDRQDQQSDYDTDLNRTLFQEYWTDLSEFKKKPAKDVKEEPAQTQASSTVKKPSKSLSRASVMEVSKSSGMFSNKSRMAVSGMTPVPQRG